MPGTEYLTLNEMLKINVIAYTTKWTHAGSVPFLPCQFREFCPATDLEAKTWRIYYSAQSGETYRPQQFTPAEHTDYQLRARSVIVVGTRVHTRSVNTGKLISQIRLRRPSEKPPTFYQIASFGNKSGIAYWLSYNNKWHSLPFVLYCE